MCIRWIAENPEEQAEVCKMQSAYNTQSTCNALSAYNAQQSEPQPEERPTRDHILEWTQRKDKLRTDYGLQVYTSAKTSSTVSPSEEPTLSPSEEPQTQVQSQKNLMGSSGWIALNPDEQKRVNSMQKEYEEQERNSKNMRNKKETRRMNYSCHF